MKALPFHRLPNYRFNYRICIIEELRKRAENAKFISKTDQLF